MLDFILDIFFPKFCVGCGSYGTYLCTQCVQDIKLYSLPLCPGCMNAINSVGVHARCRKKTHLDGLIAIAVFQGNIKKIITEIKYSGYFDMSRVLTNLCLYQIEKEKLLALPALSIRAILPIPLSSSKQDSRGFNQSAILARQIARRLHIPETEKVLHKVTHTSSQAGLKREERLANLEGAFSSRITFKKTDTVLLVDDVVTTGATFSACAKTLKKAGCGKVYGLAMAHGR